MHACYAWGRGRHGVLARDDDEDAHIVAPAMVGGDLTGRRVLQLCAGELHTLALCEAGGVYSWGSGLMGALGHGGRRDERSPRRLAQLPWTSQIVAAKHHSAALLTSGEVYSWGWDGWEGSSCQKQPAAQPHLSGGRVMSHHFDDIRDDGDVEFVTAPSLFCRRWRAFDRRLYS